MARVSSLCVYCGSSNAVSPHYLVEAYAFGRAFGDAGIELVYGGGRVGLMGRVADGALEAGGAVTGIIPRHLHEREVAHQGVRNLVVVETMHERKTLMAERADAFAVLPGGFGTLDEMFEILTWRILGLHDKPLVLVNQDDYWAPLLALMEQIYAQGFAAPGSRDHYAVVPSFVEVLGALKTMRGATHATETARL
jgi:uncharacterized protein (TIGR00730 family)